MKNLPTTILGRIIIRTNLSISFLAPPPLRCYQRNFANVVLGCPGTKFGGNITYYCIIVISFLSFFCLIPSTFPSFQFPVWNSQLSPLHPFRSAGAILRNDVTVDWVPTIRTRWKRGGGLEKVLSRLSSFFYYFLKKTRVWSPWCGSLSAEVVLGPKMTIRWMHECRRRRR